MQLIIPKPEFLELTEAEIDQALADTNPDNLICMEIARLVEGYAANFKAHCEKMGRIPEFIMTATPRSPIEATAMTLVTQILKAQLQDTAGDVKSDSRA